MAEPKEQTYRVTLENFDMGAWHPYGAVYKRGSSEAEAKKLAVGGMDFLRATGAEPCPWLDRTVNDDAKELERLRDLARRAERVLIDYPVDYPEGGPVPIQIAALTKALVALSSTILNGPDDDQEPIRWLRAVVPTVRKP